MGFSITPQGYAGAAGLSSLVGGDISRFKVTNPYGLEDYTPEGFGNVGIDGGQYNVRYDPATDKYMVSSLADPHLGSYVYGNDGKLENWTPYNDGNAKADFGMFLASALTMGAAGMAGAGASAATDGALGSGAGFVGEGAASGIPAWDAAGAGAGAGASGAGAGSVFNAAADSQAANASLGLSGTDVAQGASTWGMPSGSPVAGESMFSNVPSWAKTLGSKAVGSLGGSGAETGGGGMDWQDAAIKAGINGLGGYLSSNAASGAAQTAANGAQFRPVGVTTRFGGSGFQFDANGNLIGAGYSLSPDAAALRDRMLAGTGADLGAADQASGAAQSLFGLGSQYLSGDPAGDWMAAQQKLLAPARQQALSKVRNDLYASGRTGLATGGTDTMGASNPEMQAYYNAIMGQDNQLASQAYQQGQQAVTFGTGLFKNGMDLMNARYQPALSSAAGANTIEGYGQDSLNLGAQLGGRTAAAGANAAPWQYKANSNSPAGSFFSGLGSQDYSGIYNGIKGLWT